MFAGLQNAVKAGELRKKILFTLAMFLVFRIGAHIPVPGINREILDELLGKGAFFGFFDVISGGSFKKFTIFAMSITPYINASIIMSLLQVVIPKLEQLAKEGVEGRKKIQQYVRYGTVVLAFIQALGISIGLKKAIISPNIGTYLLIAITLTAGTAFLMWLGEMITEKGIGNGISLIIFAGIVSRIPSAIVSIVEWVGLEPARILNVILLVIIAIVTIAAIVAVNEGQRRIPVQYAKRVVGRKMYGGQTTHIPIKINQAGVIPVIFASSILMFPSTIAQYFPNSAFAVFIGRYFDWGTIAHTIVYFLLVIGFTFFYTAITFNPADVADNLKKYGGFIPGLRPGRSTSEYLDKVLTRITLSGGIFLGLVAVLPNFVMATTNIPGASGFGGTALLIVVGVALDTMKQIESYLLMRHYQGFLK